MDETLLDNRLREATAKYMERGELDMGTQAEQMAHVAYRNINPDRPLQPFVGDDGRVHTANEQWDETIKDAVRQRYEDALKAASGRGIAQETVAQQVGVSKATVKNWRRNDGLFGADAITCEKLCGALGVTVDELRGTDEVGHGLLTAFSVSAFAERYARLDHTHRVHLSMLLRDFLQAERERELLTDYQRALRDASQNAHMAKSGNQL